MIIIKDCSVKLTSPRPATARALAGYCLSRALSGSGANTVYAGTRDLVTGGNDRDAFNATAGGTEGVANLRSGICATCGSAELPSLAFFFKTVVMHARPDRGENL